MTAWVAALAWLFTALALTLSAEIFLWFLLAIIAVGLLLSWRSQGLRPFLALLFIASSLALASLQIQSAAMHAPTIEEATNGYETKPVEFVVLEPVRSASFSNFDTGSVRAVVEIQRLDDEPVHSIGHLSADESFSSAQVGERYRANAFLKPASRSLRFAFDAKLQGKAELLDNPEGYRQVANGIRASFLESASGVSKDARGLVVGLTIGDTSLLSQGIQDQMKVVGLTHLTAVSGANCAIVAGLALVILRRFRLSRWTRLGLISLCLLAYLLLVGQQPSVLRASVMALIVVANAALGRKASAVNALGLAVLILLVADPWLAVEYGFALSVAATYGILILAPSMSDRLVAFLPRYLSLALAVSIGAQLMCLPVLLQLQPGLSTYSLVANLIAEPLVTPVTVLGIIGCITVGPLPWLTSLITWLASSATWVIENVARILASEPNTTLRWFDGIGGLLAALVLIVSIVAWLRSENNAIRVLGTIATVTCVAATFGLNLVSVVGRSAWVGQDFALASCDVGQGDATVVRSSGETALIDTGKDEKKIDACLDELGIERIDLLVLTHFDQDHVAGINGAIRRRSVGRALISPFPDDRPAALKAQDALRDLGVTPTFAERGMQGKLGEFSWVILSPEAKAQGAATSNDASITMLWRSVQFNLATMADLGADGQDQLLRLNGSWLATEAKARPMILKVSHHGSADQSAHFIEAVSPDIALISVGKENSYGHPTRKTMALLAQLGANIFRTDELGSIAISRDGNQLRASFRGQG